MASSTISRAAALLLGAAGFGTFGGCGGSSAVEARCNRGDTRICVDRSVGCQGTQTCLADGRFDTCECETSGTGGVSGSGTGGSSAGGASGAATTGGASGAATGGAAGAGGSNGGTAGFGAIGGGIGFGGSSVGGSSDGGSSCSSVRARVELPPVDFFILLDQSGSMVLGEDRWTPIVNAIKTFVAAPEMAGVGLGLNYFGLHPPGQPPTDPTSPGSCNANDYARPEVPIAVLPNVRLAIENSLNLHTTPGGGTPTHPALQGAMQYVTVHALANPNRKAVIVLLTDGEPQGCTGNDVTTVAQVASAGAAANPQILTYVIGIGPNLQALNQIAQAGGSTQAYLAASGNSQQVLDALKLVRHLNSGCEFMIPVGPGGRMIDFTRLNVIHAPTGGNESLIYYVGSRDDCRSDIGGWYYERDIQGVPNRVKLCAASCRAVLDGGGSVDFALGCATVPPPP